MNKASAVKFFSNTAISSKAIAWEGEVGRDRRRGEANR